VTIKPLLMQVTCSHGKTLGEDFFIFALQFGLATRLNGSRRADFRGKKSFFVRKKNRPEGRVLLEM
jgi:hypothetical protein